MIHSFSGILWAMPGEVAWVFVTVPVHLSASIRAMPRPPRPGFGSLRVAVSIGPTSWKTSIFPDSKSGCYLLPLKKAVRTAQRLDVGDTAEITIELLE